MRTPQAIVSIKTSLSSSSLLNSTIDWKKNGDTLVVGWAIYGWNGVTNDSSLTASNYLTLIINSNATGSWDYLLNPTSGVGVGWTPYALVFNPNTQLIYITDYNNSSVIVYSVPLGTVLGAIWVWNAPSSITINPNCNTSNRSCC